MESIIYQSTMHVWMIIYFQICETYHHSTGRESCLWGLTNFWIASSRDGEEGLNCSEARLRMAIVRSGGSPSRTWMEASNAYGLVLLLRKWIHDSILAMTSFTIPSGWALNNAAKHKAILRKSGGGFSLMRPTNGSNTTSGEHEIMIAFKKGFND